MSWLVSFGPGLAGALVGYLIFTVGQSGPATAKHARGQADVRD